MVEKQEAQKRQMQEKLEREKAEIRANIEYINKVREEKERGRQKVIPLSISFANSRILA